MADVRRSEAIVIEGRDDPSTRPPTVALVVGSILAGLLVGLTGVAGIVWLVAGPIEQRARGATDMVGASSDGYTVWERLENGTPLRWDPCSPIELVLEPSGVPDGGEDDVAEAVAILRDVTGLDLHLRGSTDERPSGGRLPYQPERYGDRWAPILIAWAEPGEAGLPLRDTDRGIGMPVALGQGDDRAYISGQVVLNVDRNDLDVGFDDRAGSWGATILHELIHVLGLGHVDDPQELMHVFPGEGPVELGPGDRAGLDAVGVDGGCRPVPVPRPVTVADPVAHDR